MRKITLKTPRLKKLNKYIGIFKKQALQQTDTAKLGTLIQV